MSANSTEVKKKKRGFLGYLWLIFLCFLVLLGLGLGFFYLQQHLVTGWLLQWYGTRLAVVLTDPGHYQILGDQEYLKILADQQKNPGFSAEKLQQEILAKRQQEAQTCFQSLVSAYRATPNIDWVPRFQELQKSLREMLQDSQVSPVEFSQFLDMVQKATEVPEKAK